MSADRSANGREASVTLCVRIQADLRRRLKLASVKENQLMQEIVAQALERQLAVLERQDGGT